MTNKVFIVLALLITMHSASQAQWLLNFGTASTTKPGQVVFISGTGAQLTFIQSPSSTNFTPFLAHAGIRVGLFRSVDIGYRLCTVALPYSSAGPSLGAASDLKVRLNPEQVKWQFSIIGGAGLAYVTLLNKQKSAWSPGGAMVLTHPFSDKMSITLNARYTETYIYTAAGGGESNYVKALGGSLGAAYNMNQIISILPELGVFDLQGKIAGGRTNGLGIQVGTVLRVNLSSAVQKTKS